jgi:hypothetical protein
MWHLRGEIQSESTLGYTGNTHNCRNMQKTSFGSLQPPIKRHKTSTAVIAGEKKKMPPTSQDPIESHSSNAVERASEQATPLTATHMSLWVVGRRCTPPLFDRDSKALKPHRCRGDSETSTIFHHKTTGCTITRMRPAT